MPLSKEAERLRGQKRRREAGIPARRRGDQKLTDEQRRTKVRLVHKAASAELPTSLTPPLEEASLRQFDPGQLQRYRNWLRTAEPDKVKFRKDKSVIASCAAVKGLAPKVGPTGPRSRSQVPGPRSQVASAFVLLCLCALRQKKVRISK